MRHLIKSRWLQLTTYHGRCEVGTLAGKDFASSYTWCQALGNFTPCRVSLLASDFRHRRHHLWLWTLGRSHQICSNAKAKLDADNHPSVLFSATQTSRYSCNYQRLLFADAMLVSISCSARISAVLQRGRETLHLFQPPRADQMPDPCRGRCHNIRPDNL